MWRRAIGKAKRAAQTLDRELNESWAKRPASGANEQGFVGWQRIRTKRDIGLDGLLHRCDHRHAPGLLAFAHDRQTSCPPTGASERLIAKASEMRRPAHRAAPNGGIARDDPRGRSSPARASTCTRRQAASARKGLAGRAEFSADAAP